MSPPGRPKGECRSAQHEGASVSPPFPAELLSRIEDAGINASAPREQLWVDGWLVRFSPGKAKRARCVQAVAAGRLPLDAGEQRLVERRWSGRAGGAHATGSARSASARAAISRAKSRNASAPFEAGSKTTPGMP